MKGQMKNKKPITIKVKNFYGEAWVNVVDNGTQRYVMDKMYMSKSNAEKNYPALVRKEFRKTVKVWLVEAV